MIDLSTMTDDELDSLAQALSNEQARRSATAQPLRVSVAFDGYNARRYSRPWIARVTSWPVGGKPEMTFGRYLGDDDGGEVEIMALPGDIVRWGQKDSRGGNTTSFWGVVTKDGEIDELDQAAARKDFRA